MNTFKKYIGFILTFVFVSLFIYVANLSFEEANQESREGRYIADSQQRLYSHMSIGLKQIIKDPEVRALEIQKAIQIQKSKAEPAKSLDKKDFMMKYFVDGSGGIFVIFTLVGIIISTVIYFSNIEDTNEDDEMNLQYN